MYIYNKTFTEEILNGKLHYFVPCTGQISVQSLQIRHWDCFLFALLIGTSTLQLGFVHFTYK